MSSLAQLSQLTEPILEVVPKAKFAFSLQLKVRGERCIFKMLIMTMVGDSSNGECCIYNITLECT